jgi:hypothetical protein
MATTINKARRRVALDEIRVPQNLRALDDAHVPCACRLDQVAGHHRPGRCPRSR